MDGDKKKVLIVIGAIIIIIMGVIVYTVIKRGQYKDTGENANLGLYEKIDKDGNKINTSSKLKSEKEYKGLTISNINLQEKNGATVLLADVVNTSSSAINDFTTIDIKFVDINGNELGVLTGLIKPLEVKEKTQLNASTTSSLTNAYDFEIIEHIEQIEEE